MTVYSYNKVPHQKKFTFFFQQLLRSLVRCATSSPPTSHGPPTASSTTGPSASTWPAASSQSSLPSSSPPTTHHLSARRQGETTSAHRGIGEGGERTLSGCTIRSENRRFLAEMGLGATAGICGPLVRVWHPLYRLFVCLFVCLFAVSLI